jgi:predicted nucleotidyltransferase
MKIHKMSDNCDSGVKLFLHVADKEFLNVLGENDVRYVLIGGHAMNYYGYDRPAADLDIVIDRTSENVQKLISAFGDMRMSVPTNALQILTQPNKKMRIPLYEIDVLTSIESLQFDDMYDARVVVELDSLKISMISKAHLLFMKQHSNREEDQSDYCALEKIQRRG